MSTFQREITIVLDGTPYKCRTKAADTTAAEVMVAKEGGSMEKTPLAAGFRSAFATFRRCYPDNELASSFAKFLDALDDVETDDGEGGDDSSPDWLDPTQPADSDG